MLVALPAHHYYNFYSNLFECQNFSDFNETSGEDFLAASAHGPQRLI